MSDYTLSTASLEQLRGVHPRLVEVVKAAIHLTPVDFTVFEGVRTVERQREYVARGVSKKMKSKHLLQADGFGHAVDLVPFIHGEKRWEINPCIEIARAMAEAHRIGYTDFRLRWGGCWNIISDSKRTIIDPETLMLAYIDRKRAAGKKPFVDGPHFEIVQ